MIQNRYTVKANGLTCVNCSALIEKKLKDRNKFNDVSVNPLNEEIIIYSQALSDEDIDYIRKTVNSVEKGVNLVFPEKKQEPLKNYIIESKNLTCPNCSSKIEEKIRSSNRYKKVVVNNLNEEIIITSDKFTQEDKDFIRKTVDSIEKGVNLTFPNTENNDSKLISNERIIEEFEEGKISEKTISERKFSKEIIREGIRLIISLAIFFISFLFEGITKDILLIFAFILSGYPVILKAFNNIDHGKVFDENLLMTIASIGAFALKEYSEAAGVMLFYSIGELLQEIAVNNSQRSIKGLLEIRADYANLINNNNIIKVKPNSLLINDEIIVKAGERIPVDGTIISGDSSIDNKALTGESVPVDVKTGDKVLSGTVNLTSDLKVRVDSLYENSTAARILDLIKNSSNEKADTEKFLTRFSRIYTPTVVVIALIVAFLMPLVTDIPQSVWIHRALIFLVVSCPCALVLSVPLGFFAGIGLASKNGILIKGSNYLEMLSRVKTMVFDKTGTLTKGEFSVSDINATNFSKEELIRLVASMERNSPHPIAKSIVKYAKNMRIPLIENEHMISREIKGKGIIVEIDGNSFIVGNDRLMKEWKININETIPGLVHLARVSDNKSIYLGNIKVEDTIKEEASSSLNEIRNMGVEHLIMLSGDKRQIASDISKKLSLDSFEAELLPEEKLQSFDKIIKNGKSKGYLTAYVGDGLNDTLSLKKADVGISMGSLGSDAAIETSDVVITDDRLDKISKAIKISKETLKIIKQNITLALGVKIVVMILSMIGYDNIWAAIFSDVGVALLAVINSSRLIFKRV